MLHLRESTAIGKPSRVDRDPETGEVVIRGVKFLGTRSVNTNADGTHNEYPVETRRRALPLYEGAAVCVNHRTPGSRVERGLEEKIGELRECEARPDGNYGTLRLNPKHPLAEQVAWWAEHRPNQVGLSHDAKGTGRVKGRSRLIEAIHHVNSVDLVGAGATTHSLFEGRQEGTMLDPKALLEMLSGEGDPAEKLAKVADALKAAMDAPAPEAAPAEAPAQEARKPEDGDLLEAVRRELDEVKVRLATEQAARETAERHARRDALLVEAKLPPHAVTDLLREQVREAKDDEKAKALIEDRRRVASHQRPVSGAPAGGAPTRAEPKNVDEFLARLG